jgi:hypothetical protein
MRHKLRSELTHANLTARRLTCALLLVLGIGLTVPWASAQAALVGLQRVTLPASATNSSNKGTTVTCPAGKKVVGAGGDVTPGSGQVLIDAIRPSADLQSVTANAAEDETQTAANWYVQAFALCADPPPGLVRVSATSPLNSSNKSVPVSCPAGKKVLGTGAELSAGSGQVLLDGVRPSADLQSVTVNAIEDENGYSGSWSVSAHAICANPVQGLERRSLQSANNSTAPKTTYVGCPTGKQLTGVGGEINSANGQVVLDSVFPADLRRAGIGAWEDETGNSGNWSLTAYAICADSAVRTAATQNSGGVSAAEPTASCPAGKEVTGGGGEMDGARGEASMVAVGDASDPNFDESTPPATSVDAASIWDENGIGNFSPFEPQTAESWDQTAYAICATPLPGLERVFVPSNADSFDKTVTAECPAGKQVVGVGGDLTNGYRVYLADRPYAFGNVVMNSLIPNGPTGVAVRAFEDETGFDQDWSLRAYAICANPPPGLQTVFASSPNDSAELKIVTASCPSGKNLLGTGGDIFGGQGQVVIDDLRPNAALKNVTVTGIEDQTGYSGNWQATAYAICANP